MASGIEMHESVMEAFNTMKTKKDRLLLGLMIAPKAEGSSFEARKKLPFDSKVPNEVIIDEEAVLPDGSTHDDFIALVREKYLDQGRYFVLDFLKKDVNNRKLAFCVWSPDVMKTKPKMLLSSTKDVVKNAMKFANEIQGNDIDDITEKIFDEKVK